MQNRGSLATCTGPLFWYHEDNSDQWNSIMITPNKLEQLAQQLGNALPPGLKSAADDFEAKAKTILQSQLSKLDMVSREEFDRQSAVLAKTRMMVEQLETRLAALEAAQSESEDKDNA